MHGGLCARNIGDLVRCVRCSTDVDQRQQNPFLESGRTEDDESPRSELQLQQYQQDLDRRNPEEDDAGSRTDGEGYAQ